MRNNLATEMSNKQKLETLRQGEQGRGRTWGGKRDCLKILDFSHCPNMYLLKENLCPAGLPIRQPRERSCRNRTCPYREESCGEREQEGARG